MERRSVLTSRYWSLGSNTISCVLSGFPSSSSSLGTPRVTSSWSIRARPLTQQSRLNVFLTSTQNSGTLSLREGAVLLVTTQLLTQSPKLTTRLNWSDQAILQGHARLGGQDTGRWIREIIFISTTSNTRTPLSATQAANLPRHLML